MHTTIFALSTVTPKNILTQDVFQKKVTRFLNLSESTAHLFNRVASGSKIQKRYTVIEDFLEEGGFYKEGDNFPGTEKRNLLYKEKAPLLAEEVCNRALADWGGNPQEITHIISVSCTGMIAPGIEFLLVEKLGLSRQIERLGINFMGCFGAFRGLAVAKALSLENPNNRVLLLCTELCSLHFSRESTMDALIGNALFADGAAAVVVGNNPRPFETPLFELHGKASEALPNTENLMTWDVGDFGYQMRLSALIPAQFETHIDSFARRIAKDIPFKECTWAIHPGGKAILNAIIKACSIDEEQTKESWSVLNDFGNMSSPTFLFVLKEILKTDNLKEWIIGLGFGPGLSIEGLLLKRVNEVKNVAG